MISTLTTLALLGACSDYDLHRPDEKPEGGDPEDTAPEEVPLEDPDIEVSPTSLDFGGLPKECPSAPQVITVRNVGEADLVVDRVSVEGSGTSVFDLAGEEVPFTLAQGESREIEVVFTPTAWLSYAPSLEVASNDPDEAVVPVGLEGFGAEDALYEESFEQDYFEMLDVVWIIDNSGSMSDDLTTVSRNFEYFIQVFAELDADWQVAVITTDMDNPSDSGRIEGPIITSSSPDPIAEFISQVDQGSGGSGTEVGFNALMAALTEPLLSTFNLGIIREEAALAVVIISDEDDSSTTSAASFVSWFEGLKPDPEMTTFSAICEDFFISCYKYGEAVDATGGIVGNIASTDYMTILEDVSMTSAGLTVSFDLRYEPSDLSQTEVSVSGVTVDYDSSNGWTYDSMDNAVVFHGAAIPDPGETGMIEYPIATECPGG